MQGSPFPPEWRVPAQRRDTPPWNCRAFRTMHSVTSTADMPRGETLWKMPTDLSDFARLPVTTRSGAVKSRGRIPDDTYTDGTPIRLDGRIVPEGYSNGMGPASRHVVFPVPQGVIPAVARTLAGDGPLDGTARVTACLPGSAAVLSQSGTPVGPWPRACPTTRPTAARERRPSCGPAPDPAPGACQARNLRRRDGPPGKVCGSRPPSSTPKACFQTRSTFHE